MIERLRVKKRCNHSLIITLFQFYGISLVTIYGPANREVLCKSLTCFSGITAWVHAASPATITGFQFW